MYKNTLLNFGFLLVYLFFKIGIYALCFKETEMSECFLSLVRYFTNTKVCCFSPLRGYQF